MKVVQNGEPFRSTNELCSNFAERFSPLKNDDKTFYSVFITHKDPYLWQNDRPTYNAFTFLQRAELSKK